jgi:2-polyprenyl-6-hydroxyphenyl methylase / 3-demethylubiquinone-9 3-methyltransferase
MSVVHLSAPTIDPEEVAYFERLAHRWWDVDGPFWPLHRLNTFRVEYIRRKLVKAFGLDPEARGRSKGFGYSISAAAAGSSANPWPSSVRR